MNSVKVQIETIVLHEIWDQIKNHACNGVMDEVWVITKVGLDHIKFLILVDFDLTSVYNH